MSKLTYPEIVSTLALLISLTALIWNIVRDFIQDKSSISFRIVFGELGNIRNSNTGLFAEAGSISNHKFDEPKILVSIVNNGRRKIVINGVGGKYKEEYDGDVYFSMAVTDLPKMIVPYEISNHISDISNKFIENILENRIEKIWVEDTKNKKWLLKKDKIKRLEETARYIRNGEHLG
jgi:hypothetical protein